MITLGEIKSIDDTTNLCVVKLPTLEGVGNKTKIELSATMMLPPGIDAGYEVGDVVFVSFVDNTLGRPTVLGQLYRGPGRGTKIDTIGHAADDSLGRAKTIMCGDLDVKSNAVCDTLNVVSSANIPWTTSINGAEEDYQTIGELINKVKSLETQLDLAKSAILALCAGGTTVNLAYAAASVTAGALLGASFVANVVDDITDKN